MSRAIALLENGERVAVDVSNRGFDAKRSCYTTQFAFCGFTARSRFQTAFHEPMVCPDPASRLAFDLEALEWALHKRFGSPVLDVLIEDGDV
jgi:hypothetical protein